VSLSIYSPPKPSGPDRRIVYSVLAVLAVVFLVVVLPLLRGRDTIEIVGLSDGASITKTDLLDPAKPITISIDPLNKLRKVVLRINGQPAAVEDLVDAKKVLRWLPPDLVDAPHILTIQSGSRFLWRGPARKTIRFKVDSKPPTLVVDPIGKLTPSEPFVVSGSVDEEVDLTVDGVPVTVKDGKFTVRFKFPPIGSVRVVATDRAGSISAIPMDSVVETIPMRGVLIPSTAWIDPAAKSSIFTLIDEGRINTVVLDLKNDSGRVNYRTKLAAVKNANAAAELFDLEAAVRELHQRGVRVMGRVVTFRDPLFANAQWAKGAAADVVQTLDGSMYSASPGPWLNPASKTVTDYQSAIVREAAESGLDVILLDGIERPPGSILDFRFEGMSKEIAPTTADSCPSADYFEASALQFVEQLAIKLRGTPARLGVMVDGMSAQKPNVGGQNVVCLSKLADFIAPTVMPSEFKNRSFAVIEPAAHPTEMVSRSLSSFRRRLGQERFETSVVPWLQDYSKGRTYGVGKVKAQIDAVEELNLKS
jgi:hypothetical protein